MKNLIHLKIGKCLRLNNENFSVIEKNCRNLERIEFSDRLLEANVAYERICELPNLKHIVMCEPDLKRLGFIEGLVNRTGPPLESLILAGSHLFREQVAHICDIASLRELWLGYQDDDVSVEAFLKLQTIEYLHLDMPRITDKLLMDLLLGCPLLRVLNVLYCPGITSDIIFLLNRSWRELKESNRERIDIYLGHSSVDWNGGSNFKLESIHVIRGSLKDPILVNSASS